MRSRKWEIQNQNLIPLEISLGKILVQKYRNKEFNISQYYETYAQELKKLIDANMK